MVLGVFHHLCERCEKLPSQLFGHALDQTTAKLGDFPTNLRLGNIFQNRCIAIHCQAIGRKPQSTNAFKKALDKLANLYQSRTSSGMQWHGIQPVMQF